MRTATYRAYVCVVYSCMVPAGGDSWRKKDFGLLHGTTPGQSFHHALCWYTTVHASQLLSSAPCNGHLRTPVPTHIVHSYPDVLHCNAVMLCGEWWEKLGAAADQPSPQPNVIPAWEGRQCPPGPCVTTRGQHWRVQNADHGKATACTRCKMIMLFCHA
jgi:hypothetical protein